MEEKGDEKKQKVLLTSALQGFGMKATSSPSSAPPPQSEDPVSPLSMQHEEVEVGGDVARNPELMHPLLSSPNAKPPVVPKHGR